VGSMSTGFELTAGPEHPPAKVNIEARPAPTTTKIRSRILRCPF